MLPVLVLMAAQASAPVAADAGPQPTHNPTVSSPAGKTSQAVEDACQSRNERDIVVCGQRGQAFRVDPDVMEANREVRTNQRSATSPVPPAQALCARPPVGPPPPCGNGLGSLDLANVAIVVGTTALKAAKGEDWKSIFRPSGPDEYQLYQEAKRRREAEDMARAAARLRTAAREADRKARGQNSSSQ